MGLAISPEQQRKICHEICERNGWEIVDEFSDVTNYVSTKPPAANAADDDDWRFPVPSVTNPPDPAALKRERRLKAWDTSDGSVPFPVPELFPKRGGYDPELQRRLKRDAKLRTNPREGRR